METAEAASRCCEFPPLRFVTSPRSARLRLGGSNIAMVMALIEIDGLPSERNLHLWLGFSMANC